MANWLDKYEQGGLVLKKKTKDNFGKRENANEGRSTAGPGWVGEGTTNRGFNYNGAWGGTMQMGGSMPGSVGFTYARVAGSAPANGKYTKKTKASAQNGQEMKFYQEGLDFKPKTISQDGRNISKELKKEAEEKLERLKKPKATISQYTPKKGEAERLDKEKLQRIEDEGKLLNRFARSKASGNLQDASMFAADVITLGRAAALTKPALKAAAKYATEKTALKNVYKLNPYAFKPTEGMMYRGLGKEGMEDALASGLFRAKQDVKPAMLGRFDVSKQFSKAYFSPRFDIADQYGQGFIAEVPRTASDWGKRYGRKQWSQIAQRDIPITEGKILQKDWLKGYKEVPKKEQGGWLNKYK